MRQPQQAWPAWANGQGYQEGVFARLEKPIDFDSVDEQPVDLVFLLLAPESAGADHLKALARVSRLFRDRAICEKLRGTDSSEAIYALSKRARSG